MIMIASHQSGLWYTGKLSESEVNTAQKQAVNWNMPAWVAWTFSGIFSAAIVACVVLGVFHAGLLLLIAPLIAAAAYYTHRVMPIAKLERAINNDCVEVRTDEPWIGTSPWAVLHKQLYARYIGEFFPETLSAFERSEHVGRPSPHYWLMVNRNRSSINAFLSNPDVQNICSTLAGRVPEFGNDAAKAARGRVDILARKVVDVIWEVESARRQNISTAIQAGVETAAAGIQFELDGLNNQPVLSTSTLT